MAWWCSRYQPQFCKEAVSMFDDQGTGGGPCTSLKCKYVRKSSNPKASWFNTRERKWVCFTCAQEANRDMMQRRIKYADQRINEMPPPVCITAQEYTFRLISSQN
jgi:hypothetical protein